MTHKLVYSPPDGPMVDDAKLAYLVDLVLRGGANHWCAGAYHGTVYLGEGGGWAPRLTLMLVKAFDSFYVEVAFSEPTPRGRDFQAYIPDAQLGRAEVASPWAGQNPMRIPRDFCVPPDKCAEIVTAFCLRGELDPGTNWVKKRETGWDFNPDD